MDSPITGIDHPIIAARDLEQARRDWQALGFTVSPRGRHIGWGTANYCIMFPLDYIEILGILDPGQYVHGLDRRLADQGEGLMSLVWGTEDADDAHAVLDRLGLADAPPKALARLLETDGGTEQPEFRLAHPVAGDLAGGPLGTNGFLCQHLTPAVLRRPAWLLHANTARRVRSVTLAVPDPEALAPVYTALAGPGAVYLGDGALTVSMAGSTVHFGPAPEGGFHPLGLALAVEDLDTCRDVLDRSEIPYELDGRDALHVPPDWTTGVALTFTTG